MDPNAWTSLPACRDAVPKQWGEFAGPGTLKLKDTHGKYWTNRLVAPRRFVYMLPRNSFKQWEANLIAGIEAAVADAGLAADAMDVEDGVEEDATTEGALLCARRGPLHPLLVHLFSTPGSRDEFYGVWRAASLRVCADRPTAYELHLVRLARQPPDVVDACTARARRHRSRNEQLHHALLCEAFADGWTIEHEPETLLDLHEPSVVGGVVQPITGLTRSYTCDFVLARGCARLCVESKPDEPAMTDEALVKARTLRDTALTRVVFLTGEGAAARWYDLGPPRAPTDAARWFDDAAALRAHLGV